MEQFPNPYEATVIPDVKQRESVSRTARVVAYLGIVLLGLAVGSYVSVHVGNAWYPDDAVGDTVSATIAAMIGSPIAMTFGILPSLSFYGPLHGSLMLLGVTATIIGTWLHLRSNRLAYAWLVFFGMVLWSHNNHLALAAIMSV